MRPFALPLAALAAAAVGPAQADVIRPAKGAPIVARVWEQGADEVTFNVYRTGIRRVVHGTQKLPGKAVKQVQPDPDPHRRFWREAADLQQGSASEWYALGAAARKDKLAGLARIAFVEALVRDAAHGPSLAALDHDGKQLLAAEPRARPAVHEQLVAYLAAADAGARAAIAAKVAALGCPLPAWWLERARRSAAQGKGRTDDRLLTFRGDRHKGVYTLLVPANYDPLRPWPLLVALHGGGPGGKDGDAVVGSGRSAMNFYERGAQQHGWLVVCPTALQAPWSEPANEGFLLAVVAEIGMLFHVDENRICLTGHSMGGYGCWHYGPKFAERWAAIAPMAGGGGYELQRLRDTLTGVYLYHGADDAVVGVDQDREAAERMRAFGMDFVYAEIPDAGHGLPPEVLAEMWEYFAPRRLAVAEGRGGKGRFAVSEEPRSSFLGKPDKEEQLWFGPLGGDADDQADTAALLKNLRLGGGLAREAAERLARRREAGVAAKVAAVLGDERAPADSRRFAAEALGGFGEAATAKALHKALADPDLLVIAAAAKALGSVPDPDTCRRWLGCLVELKRRFATRFVGDEVDMTDFRAHLAAVQALVEGAAALVDPAAGAVVAQAAAEFLLPEVRVQYSDRTGDDPLVPRKALAKAVLDGCRAHPGAAVKATLQALAERAEFGVAAQAQELLGAGR